MSRRLAAVLFAVVVLAGALAIRSSGNGDGPRSRDPQQIDDYELFRGDPVTVLCADELAEMCERLESLVRSTRVEPAWTTVDRLATGGTLGADAWLTFRPLTEMAVPPSPAQSVLGEASSLGTSPIVMAGPPQVINTASAACPDPRVILACVAASPGVQLMLRDPRVSALGALALTVPADELALPAPGTESDGRAGASMASLLSRGRFTPVPYEDVSRLKEGTLALTVEADVVHAIGEMDYDQVVDYAGASVLYPFEARAVEAVVVPARSFDRADDMATLFATSRLRSSMEGLGYEVPGKTPFRYPKAVFAGRPTIRTDLPPPAPDRLRQLRSLPRAPSATPAQP